MAAKGGAPVAIHRLKKTELERLRPLAAAWQPQFWPFADLASSWQRPEVAALVATPCSEASADPLGCLIYAADGRLGFGELLFLFVLDAHRRLGAGGALLGAYHDQLREDGCTESFLEVRQANQAAIGLYRRAGYEELRRRQDYYGPGADGLDMAKKIK